jgi:hypothetical protein
MKSVHAFILLLLITYIACNCKGLVSPSDANVDKCKGDNDGDGYCCFMEAPKKDIKKFCTPLKKYEYEHIKVYVEFEKVFGGENYETKDDDVKIDCKSYYLQFSLIILILLLL